MEKVAKPESALGLRGNLYVSPIRHVMKNDDGSYDVERESYSDLIIYVDFPCGYTIYAQVCDAEGNEIANLKLKEDMELDSNDEADKSIYDENYDAIYDSFLTAHEVFGILEVPQK